MQTTNDGPDDRLARRGGGMARALLLLLAGVAGCIATGGCFEKPAVWGTEFVLVLPGRTGQVWAVAPAINLSGQREVDPLLQSDILFQQLQEVRGLTVVPVDRVVEAFAGLKIQKVQSPEQASLVCEALGCDALVVPTITAYDPYDPPKFGGSLAMFRKSVSSSRVANLDPRDLAHAAAPMPDDPIPSVTGNANITQAVGMYDATNGSVRESLSGYAQGRSDPAGPMGKREYLVSMDRFCGFAYHTLIEQLLRSSRPQKPGIGLADLGHGADRPG